MKIDEESLKKNYQSRLQNMEKIRQEYETLSANMQRKSDEDFKNEKSKLLEEISALKQ